MRGELSLTDILKSPMLALMPCKRHAVWDKRSGFIRAYDRRAAQRFHSRKPADDRIALNHALHAYGQHYGYNSGQSFRNGGYCQRHRRHKYFHNGHSVNQPDDKDHAAGCQRGDAQVLSEGRQFLLQRGLRIRLLCQQVRNLTHFGVHAGSGDNRFCAAIDNTAARIEHIMPVAQGRILRNGSIGVFFGGNRFARKRRFFGPQARRCNKPCIGWKQSLRLPEG